MSHISFFWESIKNIKRSGTVTRSSRFICKAMVEHIDFENADVLVELGAGDGVITRHILKRMKPDTKLLVFELSPKLCKEIRKIEDDRMIVIEDTAENLERHLHAAGFKQVHDVISAIPFVAVPREVGEVIVGAVRDSLRPSGLMIQLHYSTLAKDLYQKFFKTIEIQFVPFNVPPAFLHICRN